LVAIAISLGEKTYEKCENFADNVHQQYFNYSEEEFAVYKNIK
jgi:hypothetical protein